VRVTSLRRTSHTSAAEAAPLGSPQTPRDAHGLRLPPTLVHRALLHHARADPRLAVLLLHRLQPHRRALLGRSGQLPEDARRRAAAHLDEGHLHLRLRLGAAPARPGPGPGARAGPGSAWPVDLPLGV